MLQRSITENENIDQQYKERALLQMIDSLEKTNKKKYLKKIKANCCRARLLRLLLCCGEPCP